ncbi:MAG: methylenetetrahydrofolate reductase [NAD(P)H] [Candidatus Delongbacteria bacterium]|jgi:methylenetetrahydrofolate reductase (NADPH)|nr:methylenetetrahydrofolate reductase [NAD(P)H] [Candidatus Delongbacteria bacterium]
MKVIDLINNNKTRRPLFTFELLPPVKGHSIEKLYKSIDPLIEFDPAYINITYHQAEMMQVEQNDGSLTNRLVRKRPGTVAIAAALQNKYNIPIVSHLICGGTNKDETEDTLIDLNFLGVENILALRGDSKRSAEFIPEKNGYTNASELVEQIVKMNNGEYLTKGVFDMLQTDFCIGVAGYPEIHKEAVDMQSDLEFLKMKVEKGADYIVTQMFFDNKDYFNFVKACRDIGITVPIIPGIKPISAMNDINLLEPTFKIHLPENLVSEVKKCKSNREARAVGVEWAIMQSKELAEAGVPGLHYYTLGMSRNIKKIAKAIF